MIKYRCDLVREEEFEYDCKILKPTKAVELLNRVFHADVQPEEHVYEICIDIKGNVIGLFHIGQGSRGACIVDPAGIVRNALLCNASGIIIAHNHPSGEFDVSQDDINATEKLNSALKLFDITLSDHIIVAHGGYKSLREEGMIL